MKILFIGDSITRGSVGVNYVKRIARENPKWQIENAGVNGETLFKIAARLKQKLDADQVYDIIVLQAGYNDILIPAMAHKGFLFRQAHHYLMRRNYNPLTATTDFEQTYRDLITYCQANSSAKLVLTTMGCINEDLQFSLNAKRWRYNQIIRNLAHTYACALADPAIMIDQVLSQLNTSDYCLLNFYNAARLDLWQSAYLGRADNLSKNRGLHLTIDGVHLNTSGAQLFKEEIEKHILMLAPPSSQYQLS